jgi:pantothenate kinase
VPDEDSLARSLAIRSRALRDARGSKRVIIGIAGAPGAGKSTVSDNLLAELGSEAALFSMDGFHLDNSVLTRLGRMDRKGAPDTFDVDGFVAVLSRIRNGKECVYVPEFDRALDASRAAVISIEPSVSIVVTEGNYLLSSHLGWKNVRAFLDETWWVDAKEQVRQQRLIGRHVRFGRSQAAAEEWVFRSDEANAAIVARDAESADLIIDNSTESLSAGAVDSY